MERETYQTSREGLDVMCQDLQHKLREETQLRMVSTVFSPQPLRAVGVLFSPMVSGWVGGRREKVCPGCISETVRCKKLILGRDIG